ncbi:MAG TPA: carbohydrate binding domain-containing protein [Pseudobacteroides sp.]|uniref:carbohydrate binding domain-containing protein n=1 Tax=Pseudobacteroides sp. TaxID=1968840 RepID=UPI002F944513
MLKRGIALTTLVLLLLTSVSFISYGEGGNILKNPGFEEISGQLPGNWSPEIFDNKPDAIKLSVEEGKGRNNSKALVINNIKPNDSKVFQEVQVQPNKIYKVSCWIKTENIAQQPGSANITLLNGSGIHTSTEYSDTKNDWKELLFYIKTTDSSNMKVGCRLGGFGTPNQGTAYFDDISLELVNEEPEDVEVKNFYIPGDTSGSGNSNNAQQGSGSGSGKIILIILAIAAVIGALIFVEVKYAKKASKNNTSDNNDGLDNKKNDKKNEKEAEELEEEDFEEEDYDE